MEKLSVAQLKKKLQQEYGVQFSGTKAQLIAKIKELSGGKEKKYNEKTVSETSTTDPRNKELKFKNQMKFQYQDLTKDHSDNHGSRHKMFLMIVIPILLMIVYYKLKSLFMD